MIFPSTETLKSSATVHSVISLHLYFPPGYVFKAFDVINDRWVAIKRAPKVGNKTSREMEVLSALKDCENVV